MGRGIIMHKTFFGVTTYVTQIAAMLVGFFGIAQFSLPVAILYVAGCAVSFIIFVYAFCTKCPIRQNCVHIVHGKLTKILPGRTQGLYSQCDRMGTLLYFGFLTIFPQYWLINNLYLMIIFWAIFLTGLAINSITLCHGCENLDCPVRR
jgi:hypothetical protein